MQFDGINDFMQAAESTSLSITGNMTIAFWMNLTSLGAAGQYRGIIAKAAISHDQMWIVFAALFDLLITWRMALCLAIAAIAGAILQGLVANQLWPGTLMVPLLIIGAIAGAWWEIRTDRWKR